MSITIKLDAPALRALIEDDTGFKLELQRSVTAEVVRNFLMRDAADVVKAVMPAAVAEIVAQMQFDNTATDLVGAALKQLYTPAAWNKKAKPTPDLQAVIDERVREKITEMMGDVGATTRNVLLALEARLDTWLASDALPKMLDQTVDNKVQRAIDAGVEARLTALKAQL